MFGNAGTDHFIQQVSRGKRQEEEEREDWERENVGV